MADPASLTVSAAALLVALADRLVRWRGGERALRAELAALKLRVHRLEMAQERAQAAEEPRVTRTRRA